MKTGGVLLAGGTGSRLGQSTPKQFLKAGSRTVLEYSLSKLSGMIDSVVIVCHPDWIGTAERIIKGYPGAAVTTGGATRQVSVLNGLETLANSGDFDIAVIHDSARPFFSPVLLKNCLDSAGRFGSGVAAARSTDTVVLFDGEKAQSYPERDNVYRIQTPQAFRFQSILDAHRRSRDRGETGFTDDSRLFWRETGDIRLVINEDENMKITTFSEWEAAREKLKRL